MYLKFIKELYLLSGYIFVEKSEAVYRIPGVLSSSEMVPLTSENPLDGGTSLHESQGSDQNSSQTLIIIISTISGTITILTISISLVCLKYLHVKWKNNNQTQSNKAHENQIPLEETNNTEYQEIGDVDERSPVRLNEEGVKTNQEPMLSRELYQSLQVADDNPYLRINENPVSTHTGKFSETQASNYEQIARSQLIEIEDSYQQLRNVSPISEGGSADDATYLSPNTGPSDYEDLSARQTDNKEEPYEKLSSRRDVSSVMETNIDDNADGDNVSRDASIPNIELEKSKDDPDYCNTLVH